MAAQYRERCCGMSNLDGEQICGPEDDRLTAASIRAPYGSCQGMGSVERRPVPHVGKAVVLWEETGTRTTGAAGVEVQARRERFAEITPGRSSSQQGLAATCKDLVLRVQPRHEEG